MQDLEAYHTKSLAKATSLRADHTVNFELTPRERHTRAAETNYHCHHQRFLAFELMLTLAVVPVLAADMRREHPLPPALPFLLRTGRAPAFALTSVTLNAAPPPFKCRPPQQPLPPPPAPPPVVAVLALICGHDGKSERKKKTK